MKIEAIHEDVLGEVRGFLDSFGVYAKRYEALIKEAEKSHEALEQRLAEAKVSIDNAKRLETEALKKLKEYEHNLETSKHELDGVEKVKKELYEAETRLNARQVVVEQMTQEVADREKGVAKRNSLLDMEENRLKLLDQKIKVILQDADIRKRLKEIE